MPFLSQNLLKLLYSENAPAERIMVPLFSPGPPGPIRRRPLNNTRNETSFLEILRAKKTETERDDGCCIFVPSKSILTMRGAHAVFTTKTDG